MHNIDKIDIRKRMLQIRNNMKREDVELLSEKIIENLIKTPMFQKSKNVMVYLSFKNEVDTLKLISHCNDNNKKVIVPFTIKETNKIIPSWLKDMEKDLIRSRLGYLEPKPENVRPVNHEDIDIVIVPGVAFDKRCFRIGFGGGYYDRFLVKLNKNVPTIGLAYDFQIVDRITAEEFDIPLDYVITEERIIVRAH